MCFFGYPCLCENNRPWSAHCPRPTCCQARVPYLHDITKHSKSFRRRACGDPIGGSVISTTCIAVATSRTRDRVEKCVRQTTGFLEPIHRQIESRGRFSQIQRMLVRCVVPSPTSKDCSKCWHRSCPREMLCAQNAKEERTTVTASTTRREYRFGSWDPAEVSTKVAASRRRQKRPRPGRFRLPHKTTCHPVGRWSPSGRRWQTAESVATRP